MRSIFYRFYCKKSQKRGYFHNAMQFKLNYSRLSLSRTRKGPRNLFEIERVRDRERKLGWNQWKGTEKIVRDREKFDIEGVRERERERESPLYTCTCCNVS